MRPWRVDLENDVAAFLIDLPITVLTAKMPYQFRAAQIARQFHALLNTSSRTRCKRTVEGLG